MFVGTSQEDLAAERYSLLTRSVSTGTFPAPRHAARANVKTLLVIVVLLAAGLYIVVRLPESVHHRRDEQKLKSLTLEYLQPSFSPEFCEYWQIDDIDDYKKALRQEYDIAQFEAFEVSYGHTEDELLHFVHLRMINWLERAMIERAECLLQFSRRRDERVGPYSLDLRPLTDAEFREKVPY